MDPCAHLGKGRTGLPRWDVQASSQDRQSSTGGVVEGILLISAYIAHILFDSSASYSFVAEQFCRSTGISSESMSEALAVSTLMGKSVLLTRRCPSCPVLMGKMFLPADLFVMPMTGFDVILGLEYGAILDCTARTVTFHIPGLSVFQFVVEPKGEPLSSSWHLSSRILCQSALSSCQLFLPI
ncbi:uncharacterized protein LOC131244206 [Magnolia sinica]|uniref:uncharacterized protein LOC131244206 n=1 Tax=Magnolia sinica TaxID=86752 RepID=UPI00265A70F5|nr:uncharacterized protein LOC131244206 [Magnolia sinica]